MTDYTKIIQKNLNWGLRAGFNAQNTTQCNVYQNGSKVSSSDVTNQTGFQGALFGRLNLGKIFLQPEGGFYYIREKYNFTLSGELNPEIKQNITIAEKRQSLNVAVLTGYDIVKKDAYIFNVFAGPNFRYDYIHKYNDLEDKNAYYGLNLIAGVSANISYLYFDFRYEFILLPEKNINFLSIGDSPNYLKHVTIEEKANLLTFSIGLMF